MHQPHAGKSRLRAAAVLLSSLLIFTLPIAAGGRRRAVAASFPLEELSITVTGVTAPGSDALLETGSVAQESRRDGHRETVVRRAFGLRIGALAAQATGRAVLSASIRDESNGYRVRIDGMLLTQTPRVIDAHAPRGVVVTHRLEIEVPATAPAGALDVTIDWEATTES